MNITSIIFIGTLLAISASATAQVTQLDPVFAEGTKGYFCMEPTELPSYRGLEDSNVSEHELSRLAEQPEYAGQFEEFGNNESTMQSDVCVTVGADPATVQPSA